MKIYQMPTMSRHCTDITCLLYFSSCQPYWVWRYYTGVTEVETEIRKDKSCRAIKWYNQDSNSLFQTKLFSIHHLIVILVWDEVSVPDLFRALKKNKTFWNLETNKQKVLNIYSLPSSAPCFSSSFALQVECCGWEEIHCSFVLIRYYLN